MTKTEFVDKFIQAFAGHLSENEIKKLNLGVRKKGLLWNIFANNAVSCYEGELARQIYDNENKLNALSIQYSGNIFCCDDKTTSLLEKKYYKAKEIEKDGLIEFYVIDNDFNWCYIVTHEDLCGPYFCYKK